MIYDFEFQRFNMQSATPSIYLAYISALFPTKHAFSQPLYNVPSPKGAPPGSIMLIIGTIMDQPAFYVLTGIFFGFWVYLQISIVREKWYEIFDQSLILNLLGRRKTRISNRTDYLTYLNSTKHILHDKWLLAAHILAIIHVLILFKTFFIHEDFSVKKFSFTPYLDLIFFAMTHPEKRLSSKTRKNFINNTRSYLPEGRYWLDNRKDPVFPAVHGDIHAYCAYNNNDEKLCKNLAKKSNAKKKKLPNVIFIIYETLNPSSYLISEEFVKEHASLSENDPRRIVTDTKYFNKDLVPNFYKYAKNAITFSGMSAFGLPTNSGCQALLTGTAPSQSYLNIIDGALMHSDDIPSAFHSYGYRTTLTYPAGFKFDGMSNFVWRRPADEEAMIRLKCKQGFGDLINNTEFKRLLDPRQITDLRDCSKEEIEKESKKIKKMNLDFPKWYDVALSYGITDKAAFALHLDKATLKKSDWQPDRITSLQLLYQWQRSREYLDQNKIEKPLFVSIKTTESHMPYNGYDHHSFYTDDNFSSKIAKGSSRGEIRKGVRFLKVTKYADKYSIGQTLDWIKQNDNNTIFVITGDHGARDIPIHDSGSIIYDGIKFSEDCTHGSSGTDSFYVTSGVIGYLGDDEEVKNALKLKELGGKTLKFSSDHNDLVYTLEDVLNRLNGTSMQPTHRRNRNLIDMSMSLISKIKQSGVKSAFDYIQRSNWKSYSLTSLQSEYREGANLLRFHPSDASGSHFYEDASYPFCLVNLTTPAMKVGTKKALEAFSRMEEYVQTETFMMYHNRLYHNKFRDIECIEKGKCEFPEPVKLRFSNAFAILIFMSIHFMVVVAFFIPVEVISYRIAIQPVAHNDDDRIFDIDDDIDLLQSHAKYTT